MCSRFREVVAIVVFAGLAAGCGAGKRVLKVCADPNNLPYSNQQRQGFENRIAELMARDLGAKLEYTWFAQRRGFIRNTLGAGVCDVVMGIPASFETIETTRAYYRSTYVFLTRREDNLKIASFDDALLKNLKIGVHIVGDDYANPPPLHALARRNIIANVSGYTIYGDYSRPNPPARLVEAVAAGEIDVAIVWGPFAGYFGQRQNTPLQVTPVSPGESSLPLAFDIAMGVRKGEKSWRDELQRVLDRRVTEIDAILAEYGVPRPGERI